MPDWQKLVRQQLSGLALDSTEREEIHTELAAHLEETYEALLREGLPESSAIQRALSQAGDWQDLRRRIQTARTKENIMNDRVRQLWLPGFLTFLLSACLLALNQIFGPKPWALMKVGQLPMVLFFIPWLLSLPVVGAMGAFLSHRAGGSRRAVLTSTVFPVLPFLASIVVVFPVSLIFDRFISHNTAPISLVMALLGWVLAPGVALLAGGLAAQFLLSRRLDSRRSESH
ncbi:MAG: hypothetical protein DMG35_10900 [Acidobacteria bacterium]|nr:MAG: hypothetical protein AUH86_23245 [Acidobacteria bacterium 13_1_40CM_4_58_4]PYT60556.1 MAG: hypothetical protein DMG35_10900 [Acidobacteriota bacterium]